MALYTALGSTKAFRLLLVEAGKGEEPVRAELQPAELDVDDPPQYETISYCWGDRTITGTIYLNEKRVAVPASSVAALRCVRLPDRARVVWIDAICINQADLDERAQQVAMMSDVYASSNGNLVYLGEEDEYTEKAVESIGRIITDIKERTNDYQTTKDTPFELTEHRFFYQDVSCGADERALVSFFSTDWFRRVWAFQEAALAPSNTCYLGQTRLDLLDIVRVAQWIYYQSSTYSFELLNNRGLWCAGELHNVIDKDLGFHYSTRKLNLAAVLDKSMMLLASDPRDHVFGLLGLWHRGGGNGRAELPIALAPNYRKSVEHVFRDATRVALLETNAFTIWCYLSHQCEEDLVSNDIPSWALKVSREYDDAHDPSQILVNLFAADRDWWVEHRKLAFENDDTILARGLLIGEVVDVTTALTRQRYRENGGLASWTNEVLAKARRKIGEKSASYEDIAMVVLAGGNAEGNSATWEDRVSFLSFLRALDDGQEKIPEYHHCTPATPNLIRAVAKFRRGLFIGSFNRRVLITSTGHIGVGPKMTRAGDVLVILHGGNTPYVLRPFGDAYRLVGDCYVADVMQGEAVRKHRDDGKRDMEFRIQ